MPEMVSWSRAVLLKGRKGGTGTLVGNFNSGHISGRACFFFSARKV